MPPVSQRDWNEAKSLLDAVEKSSPQSVELSIIRAELYIVQDKFTEAWDEFCEGEKSCFPKSVVIWNAQASLKEALSSLV